MLKFKSVKTKNLSQIQIKEICNLKNLEWKFGIKSQLKFFKNSIKPEDVHNCFYLKKKLIGYTLLRNRKFFIENKKSNYFLFDTLIIRKSLRKNNLSSLMMLFNNNIILESKKTSFLICKNKMVKFYEKFFWVKEKKINFKIIDRNFNSNGMFFNLNTLQSKKLTKPIEIYVNLQ